jgi:hypothetical protein
MYLQLYTMLSPINDELEWKLLKKQKEKNSSQNPALSDPVLPKDQYTKQGVCKQPKTEVISKYKENVVLPSSTKRKLEDDKDFANKMPKYGIAELDITASPIGLSWYQNSCAYDASLTIMHAIWTSDIQHWSGVFTEINEGLMGTLG